MKVYHVEHKETGEGPYHEDWAYRQDLTMAHTDVEHHPTPQDLIQLNSPDDFILNLAMNGLLNAFTEWHAKCGFQKIEQAFEWFDGWIHKLNDAGFVIATYTVDPDRILVTDLQVLFVSDTTPYEKLTFEEATTLALQH